MEATFADTDTRACRHSFRSAGMYGAILRDMCFSDPNLIGLLWSSAFPRGRGGGALAFSLCTGGVPPSRVCFFTVPVVQGCFLFSPAKKFLPLFLAQQSGKGVLGYLIFSGTRFNLSSRSFTIVLDTLERVGISPLFFWEGYFVLGRVGVYSPPPPGQGHLLCSLTVLGPAPGAGNCATAFGRLILL